MEDKIELGDIVRFKNGIGHEYKITDIYGISVDISSTHSGSRYYSKNIRRLELVKKAKDTPLEITTRPAHREMGGQVFDSENVPELGQKTYLHPRPGPPSSCEEQKRRYTIIPTIEGDNMQKLIKKLNGLEGKTFDQPVNLDREISVSFYSLMKDSKIIDIEDFGKDSILEAIRVEGDRLVLSILEGDLEFESEESKE